MALGIPSSDFEPPLYSIIAGPIIANVAISIVFDKLYVSSDAIHVIYFSMENKTFELRTELSLLFPFFSSKEVHFS